MQRRRKAWWLVKTGASERKPIDAETAADLQSAIDRGESSRFGIARLATLDLDDAVVAPPKWTRRRRADGSLTLLRYAALRGRPKIVEMLLRAGAAPTSWAAASEVIDVDAFDELPNDAAARVLVAAARMAEAAEAGGAPAGSFAWTALEEAWTGRRRDYSWTRCGCVLPEAPLAHLATRRAFGADAPCPSCGAAGVPSPSPRGDSTDGVAADAAAATTRL